jgi:hypothetical protein
MSEVMHALHERANIGFGPEDIANLIIGFESALAKLGLTDRSDLATTQVANLRRTASAIIHWA